MPRKLFNTKKATHEEWLEARRKGIGGTDAATIVNMNPYSGLLTLYSRKKGLVKEVEDNEAMRLGRDLEQYVANRFTEETGKKTINDTFFYLDDEYDFLFANIDRKVCGEKAALEAKTMGSFNGYNLEAGEIPSHYYCQCQHYCMVMGYERVYLAILVLQRGLFIIPIERNDEFIADMRKAEVEFWQKYVERDIQPQPDTVSDLETLKELYPEAQKHTEIAIPGLDHLIKDYKAYSELESEYKDKKAKIQAQICARLGDNEVGVGMSYGCSWKQQSKTSIDTKRLKAEMPQIYAKYSKTSDYRVFRTRNLTK